MELSDKTIQANPVPAELVGIDVGGTFTDFVWLVDGRLRVHKESTTSGDQSAAILHGLKTLGVAADAGVVHGTTVATNALLERRGAKTALVTTKGFADVLAIGRQNRPHLYRLGQHRPSPLVPAALRFEVSERIGAGGEIVAALEEPEIKELLRKLRISGVESIAVVLLFSFLNPAHEVRVAATIRREMPGIDLSISSELLPEYREFERTATTVINAYVQPLVARYLSNLKSALGKRSVRVMQSSGGAIGLGQAVRQAARLVLSGPAGGVVGAFEVARRAMHTEAPRIITFDMGGTSTDVALCPGVLPRTSESVISELPLRFPSTDIHTVGAGGGSIARVDAGGVLRVGPESAGAHPGPACYGRGGTEATVTDANLVLGRLDVEGFLGGDEVLKLDRSKAEEAVRGIAGTLGVTVEEAALGIVRVANATMERALRKVSVERGRDPREYTLIPFGGAGPLHACELAEALDIRRILIPQYPGVLSALGLLLADNTYDLSASVLMEAAPVEAVLAALSERLAALTMQVEDALSGQSNETPAIEARIDVRYRGQSYELEVDLLLPLGDENLRESVAAFHTLHEQRYGYRLEGREVEIVTLRVIGRLPGANPALPVESPVDADAAEAVVGETGIWFDVDGELQVPCYDRALLRAGHLLKGPCLIVQYDTTIVVTGSWRGSVDEHKNISFWRINHAPLAHMRE